MREHTQTLPAPPGPTAAPRLTTPRARRSASLALRFFGKTVGELTRGEEDVLVAEMMLDDETVEAAVLSVRQDRGLKSVRGDL